jgi:Fe2+ transport system protein B
MAERGWAFVRRAGTFILASMIIVWALLYFPRTDTQGRYYDERVTELKEKIETAKGAKQATEPLETELADVQGEWKRNSYLGRLGKALEPAFIPLGWDWRITSASLASFPAREVIVGVLGMVFDVGEVDEEQTEPLEKRVQEATWQDGSGRKLFTLATALSVMVFFALCCQCASTLAVIKRETNSWRWPIFTFTYMTVWRRIKSPRGWEGEAMDPQLAVVFFLIGTASLYLSVLLIRTWRRVRRGGCVSNCGCGSKPALPNDLIGSNDLTTRLRKPYQPARSQDVPSK